MANGTVVFLPPNGANIYQATCGVPGAAIIQPPETIQYVQYGSPSNSQQYPRVGSLEKFLRAEAKTLGTIQILIGLIHIGFGAISTALSGWNHFPVTAVTGYPFWGGISFIVSGSLSVSAEKNLTTGLVKGSVGMNIISAIIAITGITLFSVELANNPFPSDHHRPPHADKYYWMAPAATGFPVLLLLFTLLEFCITASSAYFGCQSTYCNNDPHPEVFVPYAVSGSVVSPFEGSSAPPPPPYDAVDASLRRE